MRYYLADSLSLLRAFSIIPLFVFSLNGEWRAATLVLILAWATDLFDGVAARAYGSLRGRKPSFDADGLADSILAFVASGVPVVYYFAQGQRLIGSMLAVVYIMTAISALVMIFIMNEPATPKNRAIIRTNMVLMHGVIQIAATLCWFAYMAAGREGVSVMIAAVMIIGLLQRPKITLWMKGELR